MITRETIITESQKIHGNKYDYSNVTDIKNVLEKITIICPIHGEFSQSYYNHLQGKGCRQCAILYRANKRRTKKDDFLEQVKSKRKDYDSYDFSTLDLSDVDEKNRILITCKEHGSFRIRRSHFLNGVGCPICSNKILDVNLKDKLEKMHPNIDFSESDFRFQPNHYDITVRCKTHNVYQTVNIYNLLRGQGLQCCKADKISKATTMKLSTFIEKAEKKYGKNTYLYEKVDLYNRDEKGRVTVICPKHGDFYVTPHNFLGTNMSGCPKCSCSKLETELAVFFDNHNIEYIQHYQSDWLGKQHLDFYLPQYKVAIECQGGQHFRSIEYFGGENGFISTQKRDKRKHDLCNTNHVKLLYYSTEKGLLPNFIYTDKEALLSGILSI